VLGTIGTSQEGATAKLARSLALTAKEVGVDAHHIGDAGYYGIGDPEFLHAYSIAVRGRRHTWRRMALGARAHLRPANPAAADAGPLSARRSDLDWFVRSMQKPGG